MWVANLRELLISFVTTSRVDLDVGTKEGFFPGEFIDKIRDTLKSIDVVLASNILLVV